MTVKDLIFKERRLCVFYHIENDYYLFIEGLDINGEVIHSKFDFMSSQLKTVRVRIIKDNDNYDKGIIIDTIEASLSTKITHLVKEAKTIINK